MAIIRRTNAFLKDYRKLPNYLKSQVDKQLSLLIQNPRHPSLNLKKLKGTDNFEIRISKGYRLTISYHDNILELRRVGTHDILRKEG
jgi:mRNA-degrading endonuclease RelE of RelBE toxin-antitoxin system